MLFIILQVYPCLHLLPKFLPFLPQITYLHLCALALPLGLTDTRIISTCTLTSVGGLVIGDSMDADIVQQVVEPHHMTRDKNHNQRSHMTHDKGHTLNVGNVQRLSLLESWRCIRVS